MILIVDDDESQRTYLERTLLGAGYKALTASNGIAALEMLRRGTIPSLFLIDLRMPLMTGGELVRRIRRLPAFSDTPVCIITGSDVEEAPAATTYVLRKPVGVAALMRIVEAHGRDPTEH